MTWQVNIHKSNCSCSCALVCSFNYFWSEHVVYVLNNTPSNTASSDTSHTIHSARESIWSVSLEHKDLEKTLFWSLREQNKSYILGKNSSIYSSCHTGPGKVDHQEISHSKQGIFTADNATYDLFSQEEFKKNTSMAEHVIGNFGITVRKRLQNIDFFIIQTPVGANYVSGALLLSAWWPQSRGKAKTSSEGTSYGALSCTNLALLSGAFGLLSGGSAALQRSTQTAIEGGQQGQRGPLWPDHYWFHRDRSWRAVECPIYFTIFCFSD